MWRVATFDALRAALLDRLDYLGDSRAAWAARRRRKSSVLWRDVRETPDEPARELESR